MGQARETRQKPYPCSQQSTGIMSLSSRRMEQHVPDGHPRPHKWDEPSNGSRHLSSWRKYD